MADATVRTMCLGVSGRVISIDGDIALVDFWGVTKPVRLDVVDTPVVPGDYVFNQVGFAIRRIPPDEILEDGLDPGDRILVTGTMGDHGLAILATRGELALETRLVSDVAPLNGLVRRALAAGVVVARIC